MSDAICNIRKFVGQASDVTCLNLSHSPLTLLASGGKDAKVNLWSLRQANCLMTMSDYSNSISSLEFHPKNDKLAAGEDGGVFKVWDLNKAKLTHTFSSHKKGTKCFEFHAFGDFLASGASDSFVKLWDLRRKGCVMTYKGLNEGISCVSFSPDGRWLAAGDEAGMVKVWDMATHSVLNSLPNHQGGVSSIHFHPSELLMATGCRDGTAKVWDLDEKKELASIGFEGLVKEEVKRVLFNDGGDHLFCLTNQQLHVCGWEPSVIHHSVQTLCPLVKGTSLHKNLLICAEFNKNVINTFSIDADKIINSKKSASSLNSTRKTFRHHTPKSDDNNEGNKLAMAESDEEKELDGIEVKDPGYLKAFRQDSEIGDGDGFSKIRKDLEAVNDLSQGHRKVIDNLRGRRKCLEVVRREWSNKSLKSAISSVVSLRDQSAIVDVLHVLLGNVNLWNLDICQHLLPAVEELVTSEQDEYFHIGLSTLRLIGHTFGHVIRSNFHAPPHPHDVDLCRQSRYHKCKECYKALSRVQSELRGHMDKADEMGRLGSKIKEMYTLLEGVVG